MFFDSLVALSLLCFRFISSAMAFGCLFLVISLVVLYISLIDSALNVSLAGFMFDFSYRLFVWVLGFELWINLRHFFCSFVIVSSCLLLSLSW